MAAAVPTVTALSPSAGPLAGGNTITITGTALTGATAVLFGTTAATSFTVSSATEITATAPAGSAGAVDVQVTTPGGTSATGSADQYTYTVAPAITHVSPAAGPVAGGTSVTIAGTGFTGASAVKFGSGAATTYTVDSDSQITATTSAGTGAVDITVTTAGGTSSLSSADQFVYIGNATLSVTPSSLTLSVTGLTTTTGNNSGTPRFFTIQNTGPFPASNVICPQSTSPSITSITCLGCNTILAGSSCTVTITPSATPSAEPGDTSPIPITLTVSGDNTNTLNPTVNVLTYGSFYQAGYLFSIIETVDTSASIGGTVAAETDAASQSSTEYSPGGQNTESTMYSGTNGMTNTQAMETAYGSSQNYSAGYCLAPNYNAGGFTDWHLPSACQMGYGSSDASFDCSTMSSPDYIPNMQVNLLEANPSQTFNFALPGDYWSSTASEYLSPAYALLQHFASGSSIQDTLPVNVALGARCVRDITQ